jgi:hypothetical protein
MQPILMVCVAQAGRIPSQTTSAAVKTLAARGVRSSAIVSAQDRQVIRSRGRGLPAHASGAACPSGRHARLP